MCLLVFFVIIDGFRYNIGEKKLNDVIIELEKVRDMATGMLRNPDKPIGLVNPHNTCYLNVLLQSLYRALPFRQLLFLFCLDFIFRMTAHTDNTCSLVYVLQKLFAEMTLSTSLSFYPEELLQVLSIDPNLQCDVHEFFDSFLSSIKNSLLAMNQEPITVVILFSLDLQKQIDSIFSGERFLCRCCMNCHKVFYRHDTFCFLVGMLLSTHYRIVVL